VFVAVLAAPLSAAVERSAQAAKAPAAPKVTYSPDVVSAVKAEADWTLGAQLADGAIAHYTDKVAIWPYIANFAAAGLVRAGTVTRDPRYTAAAWRWLSWYQAHENQQGFVTDYTVSVDGLEQSTGDMDSTDAYAGTFLYTTWLAYKTTGDIVSLRGLLAGVRGAVKAIGATTDADGLTWAKPAYHVKYLMDQAEVYAGLRAASRLLSAVGDAAGSRNANTQAARVKTAVAGLWNAARGSYDWAVHDTGARQTTDWSVLYPDALQQTWAAAFGLTDTTRASQLTSAFVQAHPNWAAPTSSDLTDGRLQAVGYWPVAGWAMDVAGKSEWASTGAASIRAGALSAGRAWPYTPASAGQLAVLLSGGPDLP
jgi:hypothetical protein